MLALELKNISKAYGSIKSCDDISMQVKKGEVHALLGENGAGKSTLMKIIFGLVKPDSGQIIVNGSPVTMKSSKVAIAHGIGMVHQHFMLVRPFTIIQNVMLGIEPRRIFGTLDYNKAQREIERVATLYNFNLKLDQKIEDLSVGMQQRVEILKTLCRSAEIIILDEPTAVLTPQETEEFMKIVAHLKGLGKTIIIITHKMHEIKTVADRCTIIRKGRFIETVDVASTSEKELAAKMVGRSVNLKSEKNALADISNRDEVLKIEDLSVDNNKHLPALRNFTLSLRAGEITGLAGIDGNGQSELVEVLNGVRKALGGRILLNGKDLTNQSPKAIFEQKLSIIPADRQLSGLVLDYEVSENFVLQTISNETFSKNGIINRKNINEFATQLIKRFDIRTPSIHSPARELSGGNQQKIILAREISHNPDVLIAFQPTRGLDVGAIEFIHHELIKLRDAGKAILLISYELDEIINLSDRIAIVCDGAINHTYSPEDLQSLPAAGLKEKIGYYMAGANA